MGYYIDLENITIDEYRLKLEKTYLPPSRQILIERLDVRFGYFKSIGVKNVLELLKTLKKKDRFATLSKVECLSGDYLTLLLRKLNSTLPKPNKLADFKGIQTDVVAKLEKMGIKNTEKLYERVKTEADRRNLADAIGANDEAIEELTKLTDLSRIKWVGATLARMLYDVGIDTVEKASKADPVDLHTKINQLNKDKNIYKGQIGLNDMRILLRPQGKCLLNYPSKSCIAAIIFLFTTETRRAGSCTDFIELIVFFPSSYP